MQLTVLAATRLKRRLCTRHGTGSHFVTQFHVCYVRECTRSPQHSRCVVPGDCSHLQKTTSRHLARPAVADTSSVCRALAPAHKRMNELKRINQRNRTSETQPTTRVKSDEYCGCYRRVLSVHGERRLSVFLSVGTV